MYADTCDMDRDAGLCCPDARRREARLVYRPPPGEVARRLELAANGHVWTVVRLPNHVCDHMPRRAYMHGRSDGFSWTLLPCEATLLTHAQMTECRARVRASGQRAGSWCIDWLLDDERAEFFEDLQKQMSRMV